ncbi:MAG: hypothetical protein MUD17_12650 [Gemmatimonadaceae bacterium]|jgi:hypothetical protein|nr:hypothetical protein [Gemmatimonadaceae bacterium]
MTTWEALLDDYVGDVVRRLPVAMRSDVGMELRGLLEESLRARADACGEPISEALTFELLRSFGEPVEVATRYETPSFTLIPAPATRRFLQLAIGGVLLQWALTLPAVFTANGDAGRWWVTQGLGALWWPGALVLGSATREWWRARRTARSPADHEIDRERVRPARERRALAGIVIGALFVCSLPWLATTLPQPLATAFAVDATFLATRAWPVLPLYLAVALVRGFALRRGRRGHAIRRADASLHAVWVVVLSWWSLAGPVFVAPRTDAAAKGVFMLAALFALARLVEMLVQRRPSLRSPTLAR